MDAILDTIAIAARPGATDEERRRGACACRALAEGFDLGRLGPLDETLTATDASPAGASEIAALLAPSAGGPNPFTGLTADQIFDVAITRLRAMVGDAAPEIASAVQPLRVPLVPIPRLS